MNVSRKLVEFRNIKQDEHVNEVDLQTLDEYPLENERRVPSRGSDYTRSVRSAIYKY